MPTLEELTKAFDNSFNSLSEAENIRKNFEEKQKEYEKVLNDLIIQSIPPAEILRFESDTSINNPKVLTIHNILTLIDYAKLNKKIISSLMI